MAAGFSILESFAQAPDVPATKGTNFGKPVKAENAIATDKVAGFLGQQDSTEFTVKGFVFEVCK